MGNFRIRAAIDSTGMCLFIAIKRLRLHPAPDVLAMNVALIASIQAAEATKILLDHNSSPQNSWLQTDLLHCEHEIIQLP
jgi:hypothetical protein